MIPLARERHPWSSRTQPTPDTVKGEKRIDPVVHTISLRPSSVPLPRSRALDPKQGSSIEFCSPLGVERPRLGRAVGSRRGHLDGNDAAEGAVVILVGDLDQADILLVVDLTSAGRS